MKTYFYFHCLSIYFLVSALCVSFPCSCIFVQLASLVQTWSFCSKYLLSRSTSDAVLQSFELARVPSSTRHRPDMCWWSCMLHQVFYNARTKVCPFRYSYIDSWIVFLSDIYLRKTCSLNIREVKYSWVNPRFFYHFHYSAVYVTVSGRAYFRPGVIEYLP